VPPAFGSFVWPFGSLVRVLKWMFVWQFSLAGCQWHPGLVFE
jgi:hypothetical protein